MKPEDKNKNKDKNKSKSSSKTGTKSTVPLQIRAYVGGLTEAISDTDLEQRFKLFGTVNGVESVRSVTDQVHRGFAYLDLNILPDQWHRLLSLFNGSKWKGAQLRIETAKPSYEQKLAKEREAAQALVQMEETGESDALVADRKLRDVKAAKRIVRTLVGGNIAYHSSAKLEQDRAADQQLNTPDAVAVEGVPEYQPRLRNLRDERPCVEAIQVRNMQSITDKTAEGRRGWKFGKFGRAMPILSVPINGIKAEKDGSGLITGDIQAIKDHLKKLPQREMQRKSVLDLDWSVDYKDNNQPVRKFASIVSDDDDNDDNDDTYYENKGGDMDDNAMDISEAENSRQEVESEESEESENEEAPSSAPKSLSIFNDSDDEKEDDGEYDANRAANIDAELETDRSRTMDILQQLFGDSGASDSKAETTKPAARVPKGTGLMWPSIKVYDPRDPRSARLLLGSDAEDSFEQLDDKDEARMTAVNDEDVEPMDIDTTVHNEDTVVQNRIDDEDDVDTSDSESIASRTSSPSDSDNNDDIDDEPTNTNEADSSSKPGAERFSVINTNLKSLIFDSGAASGATFSFFGNFEPEEPTAEEPVDLQSADQEHSQHQDQQYQQQQTLAVASSLLFAPLINPDWHKTANVPMTFCRTDRPDYIEKKWRKARPELIKEFKRKHKSAARTASRAKLLKQKAASSSK